jgi:hypothetical protein
MSGLARLIFDEVTGRHSIGAVSLTILLAFIAAAQDGEFWQKKPYRRWSEAECRKMLEESPWARTHTLGQVYIEPLQSPSSPRSNDPFQVPDPTTGPVRSSTADRAREQQPRISYVVQFRSALPVRQALVRMMQINQSYDQMPSEGKQKFDQNADAFLAKNLSDTVVLFVKFRSNVQEFLMELSRYWQAQTTQTLKNSVFLITSKGDKIPPMNYIWAGTEFQLTFPREYNEQPVAVPGDKIIWLEFTHPRIRQQREARILLEFKLEKMVLAGSLAL